MHSRSGMTKTDLLLSTVLFATLFACGGPIEAIDAREDETFDAIENSEEWDDRAVSAATRADSEFDRLAALAQFKPLRSRVVLIDDPTCPTYIADGDVVPWRCFEVLSGRHTLIGDVDNLGADAELRFHSLYSGFTAEPELLQVCNAAHSPNGFVDLHTAGVRKFVAAGYHHRATGGRRYDVVFRRVDGVYRLEPARPRFVTGDWYFVKPSLGVCIPVND